MKVSGTAKATYNATSGNQADNGIGVTNELNFTAKKWTMVSHGLTHPASGGTANNDDTQINLTMNDMGTIKVCVSECFMVSRRLCHNYRHFFGEYCLLMEKIAMLLFSITLQHFLFNNRLFSHWSTEK